MTITIRTIVVVVIAANVSDSPIWRLEIRIMIVIKIFFVLFVL